MIRDSDGFSLVELLVAMLLLNLALIAVAPLFVMAGQSTASAGDIGSAGAMGVERMERVLQTEFDLLTAGGDLASNVGGFADLSNPEFIVRWQITDDATPPTLKTIRVRVLARSASVGLPKEIQLTTVRAQ